MTIVATGFSAVLGLIIFVAYLTSRRINKCIATMTEFTNKLKKKTDVKGKKKQISEIANHPLFQKICR